MSHPNSKSKTSLATLFPFSMRDLIVTALILFVAVAFCILLQRLDPSAGFATPVFVLTVLLTSRLTTGYFWGLFSAVLGVIAVNFFFTFPYWAFNLTITGYPLSFLTFLSVSVITSALTTKTRQLDKLRMENEKIRMRADLLRSVSHDIRTPLTSIIGSTSAVLDNPDLSQEDRRSLLEDVKQEAQWLIRTVENLLSITRIVSDRTELNKQLEPVEYRMAPEATIPNFKCWTPKPFKFFVSKCFNRRSLAASEVNTQSSSSKIKNRGPKASSKRLRLPRSTKTSFGEKLFSSLST